MEKPTGKFKKRESGRQRPKAEEDERFAHISQNPLFRRVPQNKKRIDIDSRFGSMFHDEKFKLKYKVDKRGKPINLTTDENLKRYYNLVEEEKEKADPSKSKGDANNLEFGESSVNVEQKDEIVTVKQKSSENAICDSSSDGKDQEDVNIEEHEKHKLTEKVKKKLHDADVDYARGEGNLLSGSDSSDEDDASSIENDPSSADEEEQEDLSQAWGELDRDAPRSDEITHRLALCNMDWDRIKAEDLMVLFSSFLPPGGVLKYVSIYTSEYGKRRLEEEEMYGPKELRESSSTTMSMPLPLQDEGSSSSDEDDNQNSYLNNFDQEEEGSGFEMERLRRYQLNRLKYYYAVMEFDSAETANTIYIECDGLEFESSAARVDLRFIPDDTTFDEEPKEKCDASPPTEKYIPKFFTTTALQQMKVDLTWDETDPQRKQLTQRLYDPKEKVDDEDIRAYLASSSSEDEGTEGDSTRNEDNSDADNKSNADPIAKYRGLLESIESEEKKKKDKDVEMEITWGVGLKKTTEDLVKKKLEAENVKKMTPWEEMLAKKHEKKKAKKLGKKQTATSGEKSGSESHSEIEENSEDQQQPFSDDDVDVDLNDPFFKDEIGLVRIKSRQKSKLKDLAKDRVEKSDDGAALELLLMQDETDKKHHFSLKKILENENADEKKSKKKKKRNKKGENQEIRCANDDFQIDLKDDRFQSLYTSHMFNVDPSDPNYKNTKSMSAIISEKQKRRQELPKSDKNHSISIEKSSADNVQEIKEEFEDSPTPAKISRQAELASLVKSIKRNTQQNFGKKRSRFVKR